MIMNDSPDLALAEASGSLKERWRSGEHKSVSTLVMYVRNDRSTTPVCLLAALLFHFDVVSPSKSSDNHRPSRV